MRKRHEVPTGGEEPGGPLLDLPLGNEEPILDPPLQGPEPDSTPDPIPDPSASRSRRRGGRVSWWWLIPLLAFPIGLLAGYFSYSDPPAAVVEVEHLDFGEVRVGTPSEELAVRIANAGERVLWVSAAALGGEGARRFQITDDSCTGMEMAASKGCVIRVVFTPDSRGSHQARVELGSNDPNGTVTVSLSGLGVAPELAVSPGKLELGSQTVGRAGASATLRLANQGTAPLVLRSIDLTGPGAADFLRVADECSGRRLAPGGGCSLRFTFVPRAGGRRQATARIDHDAAAAPTEVALVAEGVRRLPALELTPSVVDFGAHPLGEVSESRRVRIASSGNEALLVRDVRLDTFRAVGGEAFAVVSETCTAAPIAPGGECEIDVRFESIAETAAQAVLLIDSSASSVPDEVLLTGAGQRGACPDRALAVALRPGRRGLPQWGGANRLAQLGHGAAGDRRGGFDRGRRGVVRGRRLCGRGLRTG